MIAFSFARFFAFLFSCFWPAGDGTVLQSRGVVEEGVSSLAHLQYEEAAAEDVGRVRGHRRHQDEQRHTRPTSERETIG